MAAKERYQNPTGGDTVNLRLFTYNSNNLANVVAVQKVDIFSCDDTSRILVETFPGTSVIAESTGKYLLTVPLTEPKYCIGRYLDAWTLQFENEDCPATVEQPFQVYPQLWYTTPIPVVYDFSFSFRPNRMRVGSKQHLIIEITPNVPRGSDLARYYENLAIVSNLNISIEQMCGDCVPCEEDLRLIVDNQPVDYREKRYGYYLLDTTELEKGIYNVWFQMEFGESIYISDKNQFQIY
jgi:hypothetical protein